MLAKDEERVELAELLFPWIEAPGGGGHSAVVNRAPAARGAREAAVAMALAVSMLSARARNRLSYGREALPAQGVHRDDVSHAAGP